LENGAWGVVEKLKDAWGYRTRAGSGLDKGKGKTTRDLLGRARGAEAGKEKRARNHEQPIALRMPWRLGIVGDATGKFRKGKNIQEC